MENWRAIVGFEGKYEVSDLGRVRSLDRLQRSVSKTGQEYYRQVKGVILKQGHCRGYLIVNLCPKGTVSVHRLVALAFLSPPRPDQEVNHRDGDKHNNCLSNLEWSTKVENQRHWRELRRLAA